MILAAIVGGVGRRRDPDPGLFRRRRPDRRRCRGARGQRYLGRRSDASRASSWSSCSRLPGALGALALQRYVIIVSTAFGGAWTAIVGGLALAGDRLAGQARRATTSGWRIRWIPRPGSGG